MSPLKYDEQEEYIGNIWGWKWSIIGLVFILVVFMLMGGRYYYLKSTGNYPITPPVDSTEINETYEVR